MRLFLIFLFAFLALWLLNANDSRAQTNFNLHVGIANPTGDFANDDPYADYSGGAAPGFNLGGQVIYKPKRAALGFFAGVDLMYNTLQKDFRDKIKNSFQQNGFYGSSHRFYKYYNIPVSVGLHYQYKANEHVSLLFNGGVAANFLEISNWEIEFAGSEIKTIFYSASSIGFKAGAGVLLKNKFSLKVDYLNLGKCEVEGKIFVPDEYPVGIIENIKTTTFNFTMGAWF